MADDQIEGLPEGATVRPIQQPQQATTTDPNQVEGLPEGAAVRPLPSPPAVKPKTTATPSGLSDSIDTSLSTNPAYQTGKAIYKGARGLYHGAVGDEETQESKGTPTGTTGSPNNPAGVANYGLTPEHVGHELGSTGRSIGEFGAGVAKDLGVGGPGLPAVVPNEKGVGISDPKANTLLGKYVMAPSQAEREQSKNEFQKYFETNGAEAAGHALAGFIHGTLGEYVPAVGPIASTIMQQAANGDIGGALSQIAALYGTEEAAGKIKEGIKGRVADLHAKLTPDTPEVAQAKANVESLAKDREVAQKAYDKAAAEDQKHAASHAQGVSSPEKVTKALAKSKLELDEATFHHESAIEHAKQVAANQPNLAQRTGTAVGKTIAKVLPTPEAPAEIPAEKIETAPQEPVLQKLGQPKPTASPTNVKTPGQVQPETFPQEPTETPRTPIGRIQLPNEQGTIGKPRQLTEGTPEGPQVPQGGLPKIKPVQEVLPPEKSAPKPERGNVKALTVDEKGNVIDKENTPEMKLQKLLEESLKGNTETKPAPTVKAEEKAQVENRAGERRKEEVPVAEERRTGDRRNAAGVRVDENGDPVMSPDVQGHWQRGVFGEKPAEDIGAKARAENPEPTRAETKAASLPKEEPVGYTPKAEEIVKVGEEGRTPAKSAEEYHPAVEQKVNELSDENLRKLAKAHGLNPDEYDFNARDARRHRTERDQLAKDVTAQMGEDEKINLGRASETTEREPGFANVDKSAKGRANRAAKLFPRLRGPVDEFGNPKVSGGSPAVTEAPGFKSTVGTAEAAKSDTEHFANAKKELGEGASISDVAKRAQEMKDAAKEEAPHTTANYYGEPLSYTHDEDLHHIITKDAKGEKIGELVAKDIAPGTVEVTSNQVYGKELQGTGRGVDQVQHLLDNVDEGTHTVNSDISTTPQARGAWDKVMNANPDAVTKKVYKDGQTQYTVDMDKYRESRIGPGVEQKVNPGHTRDEAAGFDPNKFRTATDEGLTRLGQKKSRLGKIGR